MKTKQIKGGMVDFLLVEGSVAKGGIKIDGVIYQFFCRQSEMTEDQAAVLVEYAGHPWCAFKDYKDSKSWFHTALASFPTLLEANGVIKENNVEMPLKADAKYFYDAYGKPKEKKKLYTSNLKKWQETEANVFPPETTLIFIKN